MRLFKVLIVLLAGLLMITGNAYSQGVGASGDIKGTVTDPSGAVLANATVTATDAERGLKRTTVTNSEGQFQITGLPPSTYNVNAQGSGFQNEIYRGVVVGIGQTTTLDFHMKVSGTTESLEVTTEPPVVDTDKSQEADTITQAYIADLPINRRDYLTFTLLAPAVSDSTRLAADQDFRVKQTPQSGLSFYGSNGRGNSVTVDGGEFNDDSGGVRLNLSQEAVQEFQINRSNYGADLGGASGASINIVSKSGTNDVHGSVYGFFRNDVFDARNPFAFTQALAPGQAFTPASADSAATPTKDSLSRQQWGASLGFPWIKDKTHVFLAFESLRSDAQNAVPLLLSTTEFRPDIGLFSGNKQTGILNGLLSQPNNPVPCLTGQPAIASATCAAILTNILTVNTASSPLSKFLVNQFENNGGVFPYSTREYQFSGRLDHTFNEHDQAFLRYSYAHDNEQNPDLQSLTGFSRGSSILAYDSTVQASWFHQFSGTTQNELRLQHNYSNFNVVPNAPGEVGLDIPGFANLGTQIFLPNFTIMRRYNVADNVSMVRGKHTMKFGGDFLYRGNHSESHTFFPGRFVFGNLPGGILSPCLQVPAACATGPGVPLLTATPATLNSIQSAALGLPQFYQQGFDNPTYNYPRPFTSFYWQDAWRMASNFTLTYGLRYELDGQYGPLNTDKDNLAPRVSFAWDPFKSHKTVVRGGYGIYYSQVYGQIADVVQTLGLVNGFRQIAQVFVPLTGVPGSPPSLTSAAIFQTLFAQGKVQCVVPTPGNNACITPQDLTQFGINITHTGPVPPLTVLFAGQKDYQNPISQQAEFGVEREIGAGWAVSLSGIYVHTQRLPVAIDVNALPTTPLTSVPLANGGIATFRNWRAPQCGANPFLCFANPLLLQNDVYSSQGSALYEGGILEIKKRFTHHIAFMANYTYSKAFDTTTDFNSDFGPFDSTNLNNERGLSSFDQRHKVVAATILESPWKGPILSGFQVAPVVRYNSGHPFNLLAGADVNGDRHSTNDRPIGAARNTGRGPDFFATDLRVTRQFSFTERTKLNIIAEGFNIFNRTNFGAVNNIVGPNFGLPTTAGGAAFFGSGNFNVSGRNAPVSAPLAFTSAFPRRQFQFGARVVF